MEHEFQVKHEWCVVGEVGLSCEDGAVGVQKTSKSYIVDLSW